MRELCAVAHVSKICVAVEFDSVNGDESTDTQVVHVPKPTLT